MIRLPATQLGRLMLVIGTAAIGVTALRGANAFWLGVVATLAGAWSIVALAHAFTSVGRERVFWIGFTLSGGLALFLSFGPWSDRGAREQWPEPSNWSAQATRVQPTTQLLVQLLPVVRPTVQANIRLDDSASGDVRTLVNFTSHFEGLAGQDRLKDQVARIAARLPFDDQIDATGRTQSRAQRASDALRSSLSMADYQTIGHILIALLAASTGGAIAQLGMPSRFLHLKQTAIA